MAAHLQQTPRTCPITVIVSLPNCPSRSLMHQGLRLVRHQKSSRGAEVFVPAACTNRSPSTSSVVASARKASPSIGLRQRRLLASEGHRASASRSRASVQSFAAVGERCSSKGDRRRRGGCSRVELRGQRSSADIDLRRGAERRRTASLPRRHGCALVPGHLRSASCTAVDGDAQK
jgi:hypothetical protein